MHRDVVPLIVHRMWCVRFVCMRSWYGTRSLNVLYTLSISLALSIPINIGSATKTLLRQARFRLRLVNTSPTIDSTHANQFGISFRFAHQRQPCRYGKWPYQSTTPGE